MENLKIVRVYWYDAETSHGWEDTKDIKAEAPLVYTVGFVVAESDDSLVIASTVDSVNQSCNGRITIPYGMISNIENLDVVD